MHNCGKEGSPRMHGGSVAPHQVMRPLSSRRTGSHTGTLAKSRPISENQLDYWRDNSS